MEDFAPLELLQSFFSHHGRHAPVLFDFHASDFQNFGRRSGYSPSRPVAIPGCVVYGGPISAISKTSCKRLGSVTCANRIFRSTIDFHDLREELHVLRYEVTMARGLLIQGGTFHSEFRKDAQATVKWPCNMLTNVLERVPSRERFLMDNFQLLMSSISVLDSQSSIQVAKRSALLTQLATIYVPLSFFTGIWGMNIREINDSPHPLWMFGVTLVLAVAVTVAGMLLLRCWEKVVAIFRRRRSVNRQEAKTVSGLVQRLRRTESKIA